MEQFKFTPEQDRDLLKEIDKQYRQDFGGRDDFNESSFNTSKFNLKSQALKTLPEEAISIRTSLLVKFTKAFIKASKFVNNDEREVPGTLSYHHFLGKDLVIPAITNQMVEK
jgi:hypothetical protein